MKHIASILWLISFPVMIYLVYRACLIALKIFNRNNTDSKQA